MPDRCTLMYFGILLVCASNCMHDDTDTVKVKLV